MTSPDASARTPVRRDPHRAAFWLLTAYKAVAALVVLAAGVYVLTHARDLHASLSALAGNWSASGGLGAWAGPLVASALDQLPEHGFVATGWLLLVDGVLLALTALALALRSPAARPLVLTAISVFFIPELYLMTRHLSLTEVLIFLVNVAILAYVWRFYPRRH